MIQDTSAQDTKLATKPKPYLWLGFSAVVIGAAAFMGAPALSNWASTEHSLSSEDLRMAKVKRGDFIRDISVQAKVVAAVRPVLYSPAQGTVSFLVDAGDKVEQGQVLARIESPELTSEYQQQAANLQGLKTQLARQVIQAKSMALAKQKDVDKAKVALNAAKREKRRADEAVAKQLISDIDFQKAADDLQNAQLEFNLVLQEAKLLDESQAFETQTKQLEVDTQTLKVDELKRQVESLAMLSPVSGLVGNLLAEQKNAVSKNQALLNVVDLSHFELTLQIPESYADDLALGMNTQINFNGDTYAGNLVAVSPQITDNQVEAKVRFSDKTPSGLRQNQRLTTRIILEQKQNVLYLPRGPYTSHQGGRFAYVVKQGIAHKTPVKLGARSLSQIEVLDGLNPGDRVVISSLEAFANANRVSLTQ